MLSCYPQKGFIFILFVEFSESIMDDEIMKGQCERCNKVAEQERGWPKNQYTVLCEPY